jgi:formylglycine-generating enzyme required for sulfatase activity
MKLKGSRRFSLAGKTPSYPKLILSLMALFLTACSAGLEEPEPDPSPVDSIPTLPSGTSNQELSVGDSRIRASDGMETVYVPGGDFLMGSDQEEVDYALELCLAYDTNCSRRYFSVEQPQHLVQLSSFWLDRTEVSASQYNGCVDAGTCEEISCEDTGDIDRDDLPAICVNWNQAAAYCEWAGARLPTEAEWEYGARGVDDRRYPWGDDIEGSRLNYCDANCELPKRNDAVDDGYSQTAPVGSYPEGASWIGALDMSGNVWEWTVDWFGEYSSERQTDPTGPETGGRKVVRGGSWHTSADHARSALRTYSDPELSSNHVGFRCAMSDKN